MRSFRKETTIKKSTFDSVWQWNVFLAQNSYKIIKSKTSKSKTIKSTRIRL